MTSSSTPHVIEDIGGILHLLSDGSIIRSPGPVIPVPVRDDRTAVWKDAQFDAAYDLHLRLYKPSDHRPSDGGPKLPIVYYFHGGGFCIGSRTWPNNHNSCLRLTSQLRAVVIAPDYRLAPEHRLPAAIDDAVSAVEWLRAQATSCDADAWLTEAADFGRVFIFGDSSGGNITHHLAVRFDAAAGRAELAPVRVKGYVLLAPFFAGTRRTKSELDCPEEAILNLEHCDRFLRLSLPCGASSDHPLVNLFGPDSRSLEAVEVEPMLVVVGRYDLLRDRAVEYGMRLREWGKPVEVVEFQREQHLFFTIDPWAEPANELIRLIRKFMDDNSGGSSSA